MPRFTHDCTACVSLGEHEEYDLYFCNQIKFPTVVARHGNDGPEYTSGMNSVNPPLIEAQKRAKNVGLYRP